MDRRKFVLALLVLAALGALGAWSYSSGSSSGRAAATASPPNLGPVVTVAPGSAKPSKSTSPTTAAAPTTTVAASPDAYATALYGYWTRRDRADATKIATPAVVTQLFKSVWHKSGGWAATGCSSTVGSTYCTWARKHHSLTIQVRDAAGSQPLLVVSAEMQVTR